MATKVHMEALSPTMEEGQIVRWLKAEGDAVTNGDILAEIETDKATMELVARGDGILRAILLKEGGTAPVGDVIGVIAAADEDISEIAGASGGEAAGTAETAGEETQPAPPQQDTPSEPEAGAAASATPEGGRVKASPLARRLAEEAGIDLSSVAGSGPGGRVVKKDVEEAAAQPAAGPAEAAAPPAAKAAPQRPGPEAWSDAGAEEGYQEQKVSQMRKTIARRLTESLSPVPHFFLTIEVDMGRVLEARTRVNALVEKDGDKISVNDFVLKATAGALRKHPDCNAAWHETAIRRYQHIHIGVAVAVEDGLITPVVKHADRKGLVQISREVREMAGRAREKKLTPEEYTGSTFSVSNLGMFGIREFTAIINPPEAGILAVGAVEEIPVVVDGGVVVRPRMRITMSCDHRVIDGAQGSRFLATLRGMLEEPAAILI
ncbi:MAG TPA: pyruvate dehydrogenase complex dihydrolipoamide acetyltransferase [Longimicrobiales bacterium]|nr:pyruvate dehydrogenase complex dihydrolipoamide acetyltransferase [Longimicrobiales bacterium]